MDEGNKWILECLAPFGGKLAGGYYNAGPMFANDRGGVTAEDSKMQLVSEALESDFHEYIARLKEDGIKGYLENQLGEDRFFAFSFQKKHYHVSYIAKRQEIRVIEDVISTPIDQFGYSKNGGEKTQIYQYGLYYDPNNEVTDRTVNCGMLYIIKLSDNSLFMVDGGHIYQWNDEALEALWTFLKQITGASEKEKVRIAGWYFSHAHDDHVNGCTKLLNRHHEEIELERVMFNFPYYGLKNGFPGAYAESIFDMKSILPELYPDAMLLKLHTGQKFNLANMQVEVCYAHEDAAEKEDLSKMHLNDFNCTSTILKLTIDGQKIMLLGDTNIETEALIKKYGHKNLWKSDMVQVSHHCFNNLDTLYEWISAPIGLIPNSSSACHRPENYPNFMGATKYVENDQIYFEDEGTHGFLISESGFEYMGCLPLVGGEYDESGY